MNIPNFTGVDDEAIDSDVARFDRSVCSLIIYVYYIMYVDTVIVIFT